jgi:hypothetical protein
MIADSQCSPRSAGRALVRCATASALLAGGLLACHAYRPVPTATIDRGSPREYARLRVLIRGGYVTELVHAVIRPDSVVGFTVDKDRGQRIAVARGQIVRVDSYERDVKAALTGATMPPAGPYGGDVVGGVLCPLVVNSVCDARPDPPPLPAPTPLPTPPSTP